MDYGDSNFLTRQSLNTQPHRRLKLGRIKPNSRLAASVTDFNINKTIHNSLLIPTIGNEDQSPTKTVIRPPTKNSNLVSATTSPKTIAKTE